MATSCLSESVLRLLDAADSKYEHASHDVETALECSVNSDGIEFSEELIKFLLEIDNSASNERRDEWFNESIDRIRPLIQRCLRVVLSGVKWESSDRRQRISLAMYLCKVKFYLLKNRPAQFRLTRNI